MHTLFGSTKLDLREVLTDQSVIEIVGSCTFGELKVIVPEGVEVDVTGTVAFSSRNMHLAPVPRVAGTPEIRVAVTTSTYVYEFSGELSAGVIVGTITFTMSAETS